MIQGHIQRLISGKLWLNDIWRVLPVCDGYNPLLV